MQHGIRELNNLKEIIVHVEKENEVGLNFYHAKGF
ncbi:hypothetical protein [Pseudogracilibacillus auburnensis]|nr:hypothetical protein [Pseudogracilibacillus auburnensis]